MNMHESFKMQVRPLSIR